MSLDEPDDQSVLELVRSTREPPASATGTAVANAINTKYPDRKLIVVTPWPEVYLNNPIVHRVFRPGHMPYFYEDYIKGKDTIVFKGEPYYNTGHLYNKQHLIQSWCQTHSLEFDDNLKPELFFTSVEIERVQR